MFMKGAGREEGAQETFKGTIKKFESHVFNSRILYLILGSVGPC
jgi:hypothetical protein